MASEESDVGTRQPLPGSGKESNVFSLNENAEPDGEAAEPEPNGNGHALVRTRKSIVLRTGEVGDPDPAVVSPQFFNAFHHSLVATEEMGANLTIGITSAYAGEGKTTVAANIAVSTAVATERETLLVDFNPRHPRLHAAFKVDIRPGLADAIMEPMINIVGTSIKHLHILTAGNVRRLGVVPDAAAKRGVRTNGVNGGASLSFLSDFRDVLYSLQKAYSFVIVDLTPAVDASLPLLFLQQMHGLVVVIDTKQTKREDIEYVVNRLGPGRVRGFVLNRVERNR